MKLTNERKEFVYKYDLDCTDEEAATIKKLAIEHFMKDEAAQIEYGVLTALKNTIEVMDKEVKSLAKKGKKRKGEKNGNKDSNRKQDMDSAI